MATLGMATLLIALGVLVWSGVWRWGWVERYRDADQPRYRRNAPFAVFWLGIGLLLMAPVTVCAGAWCNNPALILTIVGLAVLSVGVLFLFFPPRWAKPRWLLDAEAGNDFPSTSPPAATKVLAPILIVGAVALLIVYRNAVSLGAVVAGLTFGGLALARALSAKNRR